jgi:hypothetical protein
MDPKPFALSAEDSFVRAEDRLRQEFRMRNPNPNSRGPQRDAAAEAPIEFEDDEEYEPDDVPRNRRGDDDNGLVNAKKNKNEPAAKSLSYLEGLSLKELSDCIRECEAEVRKGRRDYDLPPGRRTANTEHYEERRLVATYQRDFIDRVLGGVKNGTIIVPNVDPARPGRYQLNVAQTWGLYLALVEQAKRLTEHNAKNMEGRLLEAQKDLQSIYREGDGFILAATKVVGMTTTGAWCFQEWGLAQNDEVENRSGRGGCGGLGGSYRQLSHEILPAVNHDRSALPIFTSNAPSMFLHSIKHVPSISICLLQEIINS